jgi:hypothetical protein
MTTSRGSNGGAGEIRDHVMLVNTAIVIAKGVTVVIAMTVVPMAVMNGMIVAMCVVIVDMLTMMVLRPGLCV